MFKINLPLSVYHHTKHGTAKSPIVTGSQAYQYGNGRSYHYTLKDVYQCNVNNIITWKDSPCHIYQVVPHLGLASLVIPAGDFLRSFQEVWLVMSVSNLQVILSWIIKISQRTANLYNTDLIDYWVLNVVYIFVYL